MIRLTSAINTVLFAVIIVASVALCVELNAKDNPVVALIIIASIIGFLWSVIVNNLDS